VIHLSIAGLGLQPAIHLTREAEQAIRAALPPQRYDRLLDLLRILRRGDVV